LPSAVDPLATLAIALESGPGRYALLLGSGVSRAASIPTGWEVVLDLIRKVAAAEGADAGEDPAVWYRETKGADPSYGDLLAGLAPTASERQAVLRPYFEPSAEERDEGIKVPTAAHRAVAELVASGHFRVIVTTNFDRLLETALSEAGVEPIVVSNADQASGAPPFQHARCTVVKVHGDYLDTRIRNTEQELGAYEPAMDSLLDRLFADYGLVVCGWSGESDAALRAAIERSPNRRYTTYWAARHELGAPASDLASAREASIIDIASADQF
jgi:hypothetical protein